jgi:hypothetical protein
MNRKIFAMAEWLLERFGIPQRNESLMGDLMEEYSAGRSRCARWKATRPLSWAWR